MARCRAAAPALRVAGIDAQVAGRHAQHGIAHDVQRADNATRHRDHGAAGQSNRGREQDELEHQQALGPGVLSSGVIPGDIKRALSDRNDAAHVLDRKWIPLVGFHFRLVAVH